MPNDGLTALRNLVTEMRASRQSRGGMSLANSSPVSVLNQEEVGGNGVPEMILDDPDWGLYWPADPNDAWVHI